MLKRKLAYGTTRIPPKIGFEAEYIPTISKNPQHFEWLVDATEAWCKRQAIECALTEAIAILGDKRAGLGNLNKAISGVSA
jgi:hypothetical protein